MAVMEICYDPDANITLRPGAAEREWYAIGLAKHELSCRPIQAPQVAAKRVRRIAEGVSIVRALYPQLTMASALNGPQ
jgi:hypothetical protein